MADWHGTARSNYFHVKDEATFRKEAESLGLEVMTSDSDSDLFMVTPDGSDDKGGWPTWSPDESDADGDPLEVDIVGFLSKHLVKGEIVVLMECGAEKLRYLTGHATAFNSNGKRVDLDLGDIYQKAAKRFHVPVENITEAQY
ncbi:MAG: hypothetical protein ACYCPD_16180 [Acidobacteriaceae bacterium]